MMLNPLYVYTVIDGGGDGHAPRNHGGGVGVLPIQARNRNSPESIQAQRQIFPDLGGGG